MLEDRIIYFKTERLCVSSFVTDDIEGFMEYRNDSEWMKYQGFKCLSREEYCKELLKEQDFGLGAQLAILCDDALIGDLYLKLENNTAEIGYTLNKRYTGKGYCAEAVLGLCNFLKNQKVRLVNAEVDEANTTSIRVLARIGFSFKGNTDGYLLYEKDFL